MKLSKQFNEPINYAINDIKNSKRIFSSIH